MSKRRQPANDNTDQTLEPPPPSRGWMLREMVRLETEFWTARGRRRDQILRCLLRAAKEVDRS
jgi:hypothetical protein